jgi:prepilin-type N-terminal cleavage/methylation domain-containing protein
MKRNRGILNNKYGFTVVELLLALAIFGFTMVTITVAFTQILRSYRHGVISQRTQETARELISDLTKQSHSSTDVEVTGPDDDGITYLCFSQVQYEFNENLNTLETGENSGSCNQQDTGAVPVINDDELQVLVFEPELRPSTGTPFGINISVIIATNDDELLDETENRCDPTIAGSHFCATTRMFTSIGLR